GMVLFCQMDVTGRENSGSPAGMSARFQGSAPPSKLRPNSISKSAVQVSVASDRSDPATDRLVRNILRYAAAWKPAARRTAVYLGDAAGRKYLETAGVPVAPEGDTSL